MKLLPDRVLFALTALSLAACAGGPDDPPRDDAGAVAAPDAGSDGADGSDAGAAGPAHPACGVFLQRCVQCHGEGAQSPSLLPEDVPALDNAPAAGAPGQVLVAAGDPSSSYLFAKVTGALSAGQGGRMPPGPTPLSDDEIAHLEAFITAGDIRCDGDVTAPEPEPPVWTPACQVIEARCTSCHNPQQTYPDLSPATLSSLIGAPSLQDDGQVLVVAGDADASYLIHKVEGSLGPGQGEQMPLEGAWLSAPEIDLLREMVNSGDLSCVDDGVAPVDGHPGCTVLNTNCTACHFDGGQFPPLFPGAIADLVGQSASIDPGQTLVVAGDPDASFLVHKIEDSLLAGQGGSMPPTGLLSAADVQAVRDMIATSSLDCGDGGGGGGIVPGGPIDVGDEVCAVDDGELVCLLETDPPPWAAGTHCSTGQWWQHEDDEEEGPMMHPGLACGQCHLQSGDDDAIPVAYGGTVMGALDDEDDCRGVPGVAVELLDIDDNVFYSTVTNAAGNFVVTPGEVPFRAFRVRLGLDGRSREMAGHVATYGDCNRCHTAQGNNGAPGRVVAP